MDNLQTNYNTEEEQNEEDLVFQNQEKNFQRIDTDSDEEDEDDDNFFDGLTVERTDDN